MARTNYGHVESGRRKDVLTPDQAREVARILEVNMIDLVTAMGYPVTAPGYRNETEMRLVEAFRGAAPSVQQLILRGLEVET